MIEKDNSGQERYYDKYGNEHFSYYEMDSANNKIDAITEYKNAPWWDIFAEERAVKKIKNSDDSGLFSILGFLFDVRRFYAGAIDILRNPKAILFFIIETILFYFFGRTIFGSNYFIIQYLAYFITANIFSINIRVYSLRFKWPLIILISIIALFYIVPLVYDLVLLAYKSRSAFLPLLYAFIAIVILGIRNLFRGDRFFGMASFIIIVVVFIMYVTHFLL